MHLRKYDIDILALGKPFLCDQKAQIKFLQYKTQIQVVLTVPAIPKSTLHEVRINFLCSILLVNTDFRKF